jgi:hypothetical protein
MWRQDERWQYEKLGILKHQSFSLLRCLFNVTMFIFSTFCTIFYIADWALGFFLSKSEIPTLSI